MLVWSKFALSHLILVALIYTHTHKVRARPNYLDSDNKCIQFFYFIFTNVHSKKFLPILKIILFLAPQDVILVLLNLLGLLMVWKVILLVLCSIPYSMCIFVILILGTKTPDSLRQTHLWWFWVKTCTIIQRISTDSFTPHIINYDII